jgi:hypothetical protein
MLALGLRLRDIEELLDYGGLFYSQFVGMWNADLVFWFVDGVL